MTIPVEYETASADFARFMLDLREATGMTTTNMAWGTLLGVFEVFRRRLSPGEALAFAQALPPILRAVFVADWHLDRDPSPFHDRALLNAEVQSVHRDHQFATDTAIADVARAIRRHVDPAAFEAALDQLPPAARSFWTG